MPSPLSQRAGGHSLHQLAHNKCFWVRKSSTSNRQVLLADTNLQYPEKVPRVKLVICTSCLDYTGRQCCEGSPRSPTALCRHCELSVSVHSLSALHMCMPDGRVFDVKLPAGWSQRCKLASVQGFWHLGGVSAYRHLTASPKMLLFQGERSGVVLLVTDRTWT